MISRARLEKIKSEVQYDHEKTMEILVLNVNRRVQIGLLRNENQKNAGYENK